MATKVRRMIMRLGSTCYCYGVGGLLWADYEWMICCMRYDGIGLLGFS